MFIQMSLLIVVVVLLLVLLVLLLLRRCRLWLRRQAINESNSSANDLAHSWRRAGGQRLKGDAQLGEGGARIGITTRAVAHHQVMIVDDGGH